MKNSVAFDFLVRMELSKTRTKNDEAIHGFHEAYGVILEELDEFWDEVKKKRSKRDQVNALKELVQIAAVAQRAAEDLGLIEHVLTYGHIDRTSGHIGYTDPAV